MAGRNCHNCLYSCHDPEFWLRCLAMGEPLLPRCANHPRWPGQLHEVPGVPCRNYRARPATPGGEVRMIPLSDGFYAYVDAGDYEWLSRYQWRLIGGYAARCEKHKTILMHRQIMQAPKGMLVDHADGNKVNNCRSNLRVCTHLENQHNRRKLSGSCSRFKGVSRDKRSTRWYARIRHKGICHPLGGHETEAEAARAYDRAAVRWFREYARLNFPAEWPPERRAEIYAQYPVPPSREKKVARSQGRRATPEKPEEGRQRTEDRGRKLQKRQRKTKTGGSREKKGRRPAA